MDVHSFDDLTRRAVTSRRSLFRLLACAVGATVGVMAVDANRKAASAFVSPVCPAGDEEVCISGCALASAAAIAGCAKSKDPFSIAACILGAAVAPNRCMNECRARLCHCPAGSAMCIGPPIVFGSAMSFSSAMCCVDGEECTIWGCLGKCKECETRLDITGVCMDTCGSGKTCCFSPDGGVCVETDTDPRHCGSCANVCPEGQVCCAGVCSGLDTHRDCGACGNYCGDLLTCCDGSCVDKESDPANCGGCGHACEPGRGCTDGVCEDTCAGVSCAAGLTCCQGKCVDITLDPGNCGGCGIGCMSGSMCCDGTCTAGCPGKVGVSYCCVADGGQAMIMEICPETTNCYAAACNPLKDPTCVCPQQQSLPGGKWWESKHCSAPVP